MAFSAPLYPNGLGWVAMVRFRPGLGATFIGALLCAAALGLATWQLQRAEDKLALHNGYVDSMGGLPISVALLSGRASDPFKRVRLRGEYDTRRHYLVDNRMLGGQVGYWVVTPFRERHGRWFLVNRGWLAAPSSRRQLPAVRTPAGEVTIEAVVWPDTGLPPLLADDAWGADWPKRVQRLNVARMMRDVGARYPYELRLEAGQPGALQPLPTMLGFSADRHRGYAVQWLALGALVLFGWVAFGVRRANAGSGR